MENNSEVNVVEITTLDKLQEPTGGRFARLLKSLMGAKSPKEARSTEQVDTFLDAFRRKSHSVFELSWKGDKVPDGTVLLGKTIGWTQHGVVTSADGEMMGTYKRMVEFGGPNHDEHVMRIYIHTKNQPTETEERK